MSTSLTDLLRQHRRGLTHDEASEKLKEVLSGVATERKKGRLLLALDFIPRAQGEGVDVSVSIDAKPPKAEAGSAIFFITPENGLTREDPRQEKMELREVIHPAGAHRGVA